MGKYNQKATHKRCLVILLSAPLMKASFNAELMRQTSAASELQGNGVDYQAGINKQEKRNKDEKLRYPFKLKSEPLSVSVGSRSTALVRSSDACALELMAAEHHHIIINAHCF